MRTILCIEHEGWDADALDRELNALNENEWRSLGCQPSFERAYSAVESACDDIPTGETLTVVADLSWPDGSAPTVHIADRGHLEKGLANLRDLRRRFPAAMLIVLTRAETSMALSGLAANAVELHLAGLWNKRDVADNSTSFSKLLGLAADSDGMVVSPSLREVWRTAVQNRLQMSALQAAVLFTEIEAQRTQQMSGNLTAWESLNTDYQSYRSALGKACKSLGIRNDSAALLEWARVMGLA